MSRQMTPTEAGLAGEDGDAFGRMARGSAGVAEIVHLMEYYPDQVVTNIVTFAMRKRAFSTQGKPGAWKQ